MEKKTKSPIKNLPVRMPGQSLDEHIERALNERILPYLIFPMMIIVLSVIEWIRYFSNSKPSPILITAIAVLSAFVSAWRIKKMMSELKSFHLGMIGERAVGQYLEEKLRPLGYQVLHDIPGEGFNVDHVIIGPTGVFCVETKTISKPIKGSPTIQYDGEQIVVNGFTPERDPIAQAKAEARGLCELLESSTGKRFSIQPVVLYPGWYVEKMPANPEVWVLNEKALLTFIQNKNTKMTSEDTSLITFHLKRFVISSDQKR